MKEKKYIKKNKEYIPTEAVAKAAEQGLLLKEKFNRGGTEVGWSRAKQLKERIAVTISEITKIASYFARHEVDKQGENFGNLENPSKGYIAWLLWGGDPGKEWAQGIKNELKKSEEKY